MCLAARGFAAAGIDGAPTAIKKARAKAKRRGLTAQFDVADALNLSMPKQQFDTVIDSGLFHVFSDEDRARFSDSLARVIRLDGTYFLMCFSDLQPGVWGPRRVTQAEIRSVFSDPWRVNYIKASSFEMNEGHAHAWLASISRLARANPTGCNDGLCHPYRVNLTPGRRRFNELAGTNVDRLAGISDGIFAVGMTLLVLGLAVPALNPGATEGDLWQALLRLGPNVLVYTMSFMTLGIFWVGQGTQLNLLARSNRNYSWLQLAFLLSVTLVPFSTALLARFPTFRLALVEYWLNIVLLGVTLLAGLQYGLRAHLLKESEIPEVAPLMRARILIAQSLYAIATATCIFFPTWVSITLIFLVQLNYVIT